MNWENGEVIISLNADHYVRCWTRFSPHWNYVWAGTFTYAHTWRLDVVKRDSDDDRIVLSDYSQPFPTKEQAQADLEQVIDARIKDLREDFAPPRPSPWAWLQQLADRLLPERK